MTESQYELRADEVISNAWAEYEGRAWEAEKGEYTRDVRVYFVDDDLVVAITDSLKHDFITCFHEHPGGRHTSRAAMPPVGQRRLEYKERLDAEEKGKMIIDLKRIAGVKR
jgi:hypothetical protein